MTDIRWIQRFNNYSKALARLEEAASIASNSLGRAIDDLIKEGVIQRFEFTHELSWKVMKDYLEFQGISIGGSRDALREALKIGLINDREWMDTIKSRNLTSHTYDEDIATEVFTNIIERYIPLMREFRSEMEKKL